MTMKEWTKEYIEKNPINPHGQTGNVGPGPCCSGAAKSDGTDGTSGDPGEPGESGPPGLRDDEMKQIPMTKGDRERMNVYLDGILELVRDLYDRLELIRYVYNGVEPENDE